MPTYYTITYNEASSHGACAQADAVTMTLENDGWTKHGGTYVDLLTVYHVPVDGVYPTTFTLTITYSTGYAVEPIFKYESGNTTYVTSVDDEEGEWTLTFSGPSSTQTTNFQLDSNGSAPPEKLRIRVKRQTTFSTSTGPFDDQI